MHVKSAPLPLRILTHNIRYATTRPDPGEEPWPNRLPLILEELEFATLYTPETFVCLQEALHGQLHDILSGLNAQALAAFEGNCSEDSNTDLSYEQKNQRLGEAPEWAYLGVGRADGRAAGEFEPILYRPSVFKLAERVHIWLSETPHIPGSKSWDAASVRMATLGVFIHRATGKEVVVCNTHLDDQGATSRREGAWLLCELLQQYNPRADSVASFSTPLPDRTLVLAGDLNSAPHGEAYAILSGQLNSRSQSRVHFHPNPEPDPAAPRPGSHSSSRQLFSPAWHLPTDDSPSPLSSDSTHAPEITLTRLHDNISPFTYDGPRRDSTHHATLQEPYHFHTPSPRHSFTTSTGHALPTSTSRRTNSPVTDVRAHARHTYGDNMTFTGFRGKRRDAQRLDFIFVGPSSPVSKAELSSRRTSAQGILVHPDAHAREGRLASTLSTGEHGLGLERGWEKQKKRWEVKSYAVLPNRFDDGVWMSDHRACVADLVLL